MLDLSPWLMKEVRFTPSSPGAGTGQREDLLEQGKGHYTKILPDTSEVVLAYSTDHVAWLRHTRLGSGYELAAV